MRLIAQTEIGQQRAGQNAAQWQGSLAAYLLGLAADGQHPNLAAALSGQPANGGPAPGEPFFDQAMKRILAGLLADPPS